MDFIQNFLGLLATFVGLGGGIGIVVMAIALASAGHIVGCVVFLVLAVAWGAMFLTAVERIADW